MFHSIVASTKGEAHGIVRFVVAGESPDSPSGLGEIREVWNDGQRLIEVGLGANDRPQSTFVAAGAMGRRLAELKLHRVSLEGAYDAEQLGTALQVLAWDHRFLKGTATAKADWPELHLVVTDKKRVAAIEDGLKIGAAMNVSRSLSITPPNIATPAYIAKEAEQLAEELGLSLRVIKGKELAKERMEGHINVGKASENEPMLIRLEYKPKGVKGKPVVLIGKTMCYDTGGLSIKPREGMAGMKQDKDGGCAVLGAMRAIAEVVQPKVPVVALLCAAENSISDEAYRPDDVLTFRNGVTVEVTNTDAEGRLVLADGLCWACDEEDPAVVIDIATLTGGVVTALGKVFAGAFTNDEAALQKVHAAAEKTGERIWQLPLNDDYRELMKSSVADILNSNPNRQAHPVQGAAFLSYFVKPGVPWVHLDIAGVHNSDKDFGPFIKGPNGWGVRLLAEVVNHFA